MTVCIGMDAHARTCTYKAKDEKGKLLEERTIGSTPHELDELAGRFPGSTVVLEASSVHEWIYDHLTAQGIHVFPAHPQNIRRATGKKRDDIDAGFLVDAYHLGVLRPAYVPPMEIRELRQISRHRAFLLQQATRYKNRIHGILKRRGQRILDDNNIETTNLFTKKRRQDLLHLNDQEIPTLLELLDGIQQKLRESNKKIRQIVHANRDVQLLCTIPGIGPVTALIIYAEAGDTTRFANGERFAAYFGLVPGETQSGDMLRRGHITKRGSSLARWALSQAAWQHVKHAPKSFITRKYKSISERAGKKRASIAVARMLAVISYCLLKEKRAWYD